MSPRQQRGDMQAAAARRPAPTAHGDNTGAREPRRPVVRLTPVKTTFELDAALLRRVKAWAGRRVLSVAVVVRALLTDLVEDERTAARVAELLDAPGRASAPTVNAVKTTYDIEPGLYGELRAWVAEHDTTAAAVVRVLMRELLAGGELPRRIEARANQ